MGRKMQVATRTTRFRYTWTGSRGPGPFVRARRARTSTRVRRSSFAEVVLHAFHLAQIWTRVPAASRPCQHPLITRPSTAKESVRRRTLTLRSSRPAPPRRAAAISPSPSAISVRGRRTAKAQRPTDSAGPPVQAAVTAPRTNSTTNPHAHAGRVGTESWSSDTAPRRTATNVLEHAPARRERAASPGTRCPPRGGDSQRVPWPCRRGLRTRAAHSLTRDAAKLPSLAAADALPAACEDPGVGRSAPITVSQSLQHDAWAHGTSRKTCVLRVRLARRDIPIVFCQYPVCQRHWWVLHFHLRVILETLTYSPQCISWDDGENNRKMKHQLPSFAL